MFRIQKYIFQLLRYSKGKDKNIVFIVGCQRSGTTYFALNLLDRDYRTTTYNDTSALTSQDPNRLRLNPLPMVEASLERNRAPVNVIKALVESQNILTLLEYFENSKAIWIYRHYKDVASSNLRKFGLENGISDLRPIALASTNDWRAEGVSPFIIDLVRRHFSESMNPYDAAALFWYVRNSLFFQLNLENNSNVALCSYDSLVTSPEQTVIPLYRFLNLKYPGSARILADLHSKSFRKGSDLQVSREIEFLCDDLYHKLNTVCASKIKLLQ